MKVHLAKENMVQVSFFNYTVEIFMGNLRFLAVFLVPCALRVDIPRKYCITFYLFTAVNQVNKSFTCVTTISRLNCSELGVCSFIIFICEIVK